MMKHIYYIAVILALLGVIWYLIDHNRTEQNKRMSDNLEFQRTIEAKRADIAQKDSLIAISEQERRYDSLKARASQIAQNRVIAAYRKRAAEKRPGIQPVLDSIPDLREFVAIQDKIISGQDSVIAIQERQYIHETGQLNDIIALQRFQITDHVKINEAAQAEIT